MKEVPKRQSSNEERDDNYVIHTSNEDDCLKVLSQTELSRNPITRFELMNKSKLKAAEGMIDL